MFFAVIDKTKYFFPETFSSKKLFVLYSGVTSNSVSYLFLTTDEQNVDLTIETLDSNGAVLFSKTVNNVPFKRNRVTILTGAMYTNDAVSGTFKLETAWLTKEDVAF